VGSAAPQDAFLFLGVELDQRWLDLGEAFDPVEGEDRLLDGVECLLLVDVLR